MSGLTEIILNKHQEPFSLESIVSLNDLDSEIVEENKKSTLSENAPRSLNKPPNIFKESLIENAVHSIQNEDLNNQDLNNQDLNNNNNIKENANDNTNNTKLSGGNNYFTNVETIDPDNNIEEEYVPPKKNPFKKMKEKMTTFFDKFKRNQDATIMKETSTQKKHKYIILGYILIFVISFFVLIINQPNFLFNETEHEEDHQIDSKIFIRIIIISLIIAAILTASIYMIYDSKQNLELYQLQQKTQQYS